MKFEIMLIFLFYLRSFSGESVDNTSFSLKCILKTLRQVPYKKNDVIFIIARSHDDQKLSLLTSALNRPVIIAQELLNSFSELRRIEPSAFFIYAENFVIFKIAFSELNTTHQNWHPTSKWIIFLCTSEANIKHNIVVRNIAKILRTVHVYDFEVLIKNHTQSAVNILTWFPFSKANKCRRYLNVTQIDSCQLHNATNMIPNHFDKIPDKLPKGCLLRVCGFHWPPYVYEDPETLRSASNMTEKRSVNFINGYHISTIQTFASLYNIKVQYVAVEEGSRWGMVLDNGTWTGTLGALQSSKAEAAIGGALQTTSRFTGFDCSSTLNPIFFKFYLSLPGKLPHWKSLLHLFSPTLWFFLTVVYISTSFFIWFLSKSSPIHERDHFKNAMSCFLTLYQVAVGSSAHCIPKSLAVRLAFLLWLIYNFHVSLVYSSSLLSVITSPTYSQRMKTLQELSESNLKLIVVKQFLQVSNMMDEEMKTIFQKKYTPPTSADLLDEIKRMILKQDVAIFDPTDHFEILAKEKILQLYTLNNVVRLNIGIYLKRGSIFLPLLNDLQLAVLENGMFIKWRAEILRSYKKHLHNSYDNMSPLTLEQLSGSFYVLIFGLSLSVMIFVIEMVFFK